MKERMDGLEDAAIICRSMFEEERTNYEGRFFSAKGIIQERSMPKPTRGFIPILIGTSGEKIGLKIAAKHADIVQIAHPLHPRILKRKVRVLKKHCKAVGRDFEEITLSTPLYAVLRESRELIERYAKFYVPLYDISESDAREAVEMAMGPEKIIESVKQCRDIGIKLFSLFRFDPAQLETFKKEVIMKL